MEALGESDFQRRLAVGKCAINAPLVSPGSETRVRNSPKNAFVKNFSIWLVTIDQEKLSEVLPSSVNTNRPLCSSPE